MHAAPEPSELRELAVRAARETGALLQHHNVRGLRGLDTKSTKTDMVSDADREAEPKRTLQHDRADVRAHALPCGELAEEHDEGPSGDWEREQRQQRRGLQCARGHEGDQDGTSSS